jgi:hypothetical protein
MALLPDTELVECENSLKAIETVYEEYYRKGWTDGLPVIPPTEDNVTAMMSTVDMSPDDVIGKLGPRFADATIRKLAINAVMAGCLPSYFPVIVTATEAIIAPEFGVQLHQTTTSPTAILILVNGPVRQKISLNCSWGLFGPGWRANSTIGRAISLIMLNVGGRIPGEVTKSVFAHPGRYGMCVGEREEASPWEPFHVEHGFSADKNVVTVFASDGYHGMEAVHDTTSDSLLDTLASMLRFPLFSMVRPCWGENELFLFFCPEYAEILKRGGCSKRDVKEYFYEHTIDIPRSAVSKNWMERIEKFDRGEMENFYSSKAARIRAGLIKPGQNQITEKGVALAARAEQFELIVAGGDGGINGVMIPPWTHTNMVLRPIKCAKKGVYD